MFLLAIGSLAGGLVARFEYWWLLPAALFAYSILAAFGGRFLLWQQAQRSLQAEHRRIHRMRETGEQLRRARAGSKFADNIFDAARAAGLEPTALGGAEQGLSKLTASELAKLAIVYGMLANELVPVPPALLTTGPGGDFTKHTESDSVLDMLGQ